MSSGFKIGRIFGINIRIDWSWLVIFLLVTWNLGAAMTVIHPEWGTAVQWIVAVAGSLLFFFSVLAHELAHSIIAKSRGLPVNSIRLHLFGGVSNIGREPDSPGGEFVMAIMGPVTSLVIGGALLLLVAFAANDVTTATTTANLLAQLSPTWTIVAWLGSVNILLGVFNMIPGFPLDGGRVLRSIIWGITDNLQLATRWASLSGRAIAWLMIAAGIAMAFGVRIPFLGEGFIGGLWLAFIGWFLHNAAVQSYQQMIIRDALEDVCISELMRRSPPTVSSNLTVAELVHDYIMQTDEQGFAVIDDGVLTGLVSVEQVRDIQQEAWTTTRVQEIMTPASELSPLRPDDDASRALDRLSDQNVREVPVLRNGQLEGIVRRRDIVRWLRLQSDDPVGPQMRQ
jgi:Zn-dependent protease/CBS domain-containing protein